MRLRRLRGLRLLAGGAGLISVLAMVAPGAHADTVTSGSITLVNTDPLTLTGEPDGSGNLPVGTPDYSSMDAIISLIDNTPADADLYAAFYSLQHVTDHDTAGALEDAATRGVDVNVVIDNKMMSSGPHNSDIISELESYTPAINVIACEDACDGNVGIAHSKFFLFSSTKNPDGDAVTDVVANGSQNMVPQQAMLHNNFVISYDDSSLYTGFKNYWTAMSNDNAVATNSAVSTPAENSSGTLITYFSPRSSSDDVNAAFVNKLDCSKGGTIYAESSTWDSDRTTLNDALEDQSDAGCTVDVIMDDNDGPVDNDGVPADEDAVATGTNKPMNANAFSLHGIKVYGLTPGGCRYVPNTPSSGHCHGTYGGSHEKFLVIQGEDSDNNPIDMVMSGSQNFTERSLTNDTETTMQISDSTIVAGFIDDFNRQLSEMLTVNPDKYPNGSFSTVNTAAAKSQDQPSVARNSDYTAVAWADSGNPEQASSGKYGAIYVKLMASDGSTIYEVPVQDQGSADSGKDYRHPSVGLDDDGNAYVAWQDDDDANGSYNIVMRKITNNGTGSPVVGARTRVNANAAHDQLAPALAATGDGDVSVVWDDQATGTDEIRMATYDSSGTKVDEFQVNATSTGTHIEPAVSVYPSGTGDWTSVVVWRDDSDGNGFGDIYGTALTSGGTTVWSEGRMNYAGAGDQVDPTVSANADGFVVGWESELSSACHTYDTLPGSTIAATDTSNCVEVRSFDSSGVAAAHEFVVSNGLFDTNGYADSTQIGDQTNPVVAIDDDGDYVVAWQELTPLHNGWDIYARSFTADGGSNADTLSEYRMNPIITHDQTSPTIASDGDGNFVLVYDDDLDENGSTQLFERDGFTIG
jgi:PLD-like domain